MWNQLVFESAWIDTWGRVLVEHSGHFSIKTSAGNSASNVRSSNNWNLRSEFSSNLESKSNENLRSNYSSNTRANVNSGSWSNFSSKMRSKFDADFRSNFSWTSRVGINSQSRSKQTWGRFWLEYWGHTWGLIKVRSKLKIEVRFGLNTWGQIWVKYVRSDLLKVENEVRVGPTSFEIRAFLRDFAGCCLKMSRRRRNRYRPRSVETSLDRLSEPLL